MVSIRMLVCFGFFFALKYLSETCLFAIEFWNVKFRIEYGLFLSLEMYQYFIFFLSPRDSIPVTTFRSKRYVGNYVDGTRQKKIPKTTTNFKTNHLIKTNHLQFLNLNIGLLRVFFGY